MLATVVGLRQVDPRLVDLVRAYAGGPWTPFRRVRLRSALPALLGGLRVAAPAAVLGSILAEFGSGTRWGLGTFLLGSLGRADPPRLWGIGLVANALAGSAYLLLAVLGSRVTGATAMVTLAAEATPERLGQGGTGRRALAGLAVAVALGAWWLLVTLSGLSPVVVKTPLAVLDYLAWAPRAAVARGRLASALGQTVALALAGLLAGLAFALGLAVLGTVRPGGPAPPAA